MILCIGTTPTLQRTMIFDRMTLDEVNRAVEVREYASGKAVNVARVLTALGEQAMALGFSGGRRGAALRENLVRDRIPHRMLPVSAETRLCTTLIDRAGGSVTELVEETGPVLADELGALEAHIELHARSARALVLSGTLAPGVPADFCARHVGLAQHVIVDAKGEALRLAMARPGCIAKLNRQELAQTIERPLDTDADLTDAVRRHAPAGGLLVVTLGKEGAIASDGARLWRIHIPTVKVVSPIGSGDAFAAGLAAGIVRGWEIERQLALAAACGVANALTADSGHLVPFQIERLLAEVRIEAAP